MKSAFAFLLPVFLFSAAVEAQELRCDPKRVQGNDVLAREMRLRAADDLRVVDVSLLLDCPGSGASLKMNPADTRYRPFEGGRIERELRLLSRVPTGEGDEVDVTLELTLRGEGQGWANPKNQVAGTEYRVTWVERRSASDEADGRVDNPVRSVEVRYRTYRRKGSFYLSFSEFRTMKLIRAEARSIVGTSLTETFQLKTGN